MNVLRFPAAARQGRPAAPATQYAELQVTTNFSFLRGASHPEELVPAAAAMGHAALAVTDRNSVAGLVRAHIKARECGLRLLIGARLDFEDGTPSLLCFPPDRPSYGRLTRMLTEGKRRTVKGDCRLTRADLLEFGEDQILVALPPTTVEADFRGTLSSLREAFGDRLYLAASHLYRGDDARRLHRLARLAQEARVPLVATNDILYHTPERRRLQDVMVCIREGCTLDSAGLRLEPNAERHLKPPAEMARLFAACPEAVARTVEIVERCRFDLEEVRAAYEYPEEIAPDGEPPQDRLVRLTEEALARRYGGRVPEKVRRQADDELRLIGERGYAPFFLTVEDIVRFAREERPGRKPILCQGRGSAANSVVCFALGITAADPEISDLLFARFISTARDEPPDIDVDFEHERREEVIQYVYRRYGRHRAGMTATVIRYRTRGAIREVGKALGLSEDVVGALAGSVRGWGREGITPEQARGHGFDADDPRLALALELSRELIDFPRHLSQHPGGFVITRGRLDELCTIENAAMAGRTMISWDKDDIDALGILKVDVLALGMLTCLSKSYEMLKARGVDIAPATDPRDKRVYDMLSDAASIGVFQVESRAQQSMLPRLKPRNFYDLVIEVAIVRPGPIQGDMVHPYLRRRANPSEVSYPKKELEEVLKKTLGVPLFQEQCMRIAMVAAEFSEAEADQLRRAMATFSKAGDIAKFERRFVGKMVERGYQEEFAQRCFSQIKGFGTYGFPESHAASFAILVYASAWVKCHHPDVFCAALLNSQPMGFYAPAQLVRDARKNGVEILPIDVNHSQWDHVLVDRGGRHHALRLGLRLVAGLPEEATRAMVARRGAGYVSPADLARRGGLAPRALRRLAEADAFGSFGLDRREAIWALGGLDEEDLPLFQASPPLAPEPLPAPAFLPRLPPSRAIAEDYAFTGLSLKRHPVAFLRPAFARKRLVCAQDLRTLPNGRRLTVAGLVLFRQRPGTASGTIFMTIEDETGAANLIVWPKISERHRRAVYGSRLIACTGRLQREGQVVHVVAERLDDWSFELGRLKAGDVSRFGRPHDPHEGDRNGMRLKSRDFR